MILESVILYLEEVEFVTSKFSITGMVFGMISLKIFQSRWCLARWKREEIRTVILEVINFGLNTFTD